MSDVSVRHISKSYQKGKTQALEDISLEVSRGELFGLIGPDGAGKTSLFRILTTLILPDQGSASVLGLDVMRDFRKIRNAIGYMPGRFSLYQDLSVEENLRFFATVFNTRVEENYELIRDIYGQLEPFKNRRAGKLSGGMKQKLALCCALIHRPKILFLDEPTTGVDTISRKEFWEMLHQLKARGITIMVSTPYMDEATRCDRIALIQSGRILSIETPQQIIANYPDPLYAVRSDRMSHLLRDLRLMQEVKSCYAFGGDHHITLRDAVSPAAVTVRLHAFSHPETELRQIAPTIEDCFIQLMHNPNA